MTDAVSGRGDHGPANDPEDGTASTGEGVAHRSDIGVETEGGAPSDHGDSAFPENESPPKVEEQADGHVSPPRLPLRQVQPGRSGTQQLSSPGSPGLPGSSPVTQLQSTATTSVSLTDIHTIAYNDETHDAQGFRSRSGSRNRSISRLAQHKSRSGSETEDNASIRSYLPTLEAGGDVESLLGDVLNAQDRPAWKGLESQASEHDFFESHSPDAARFEEEFEHEFDELESLEADRSNEGSLIEQWRSKLKHFFILSSAGKPVYSRHGDDALISNSIGILHTIISFHLGADDELKCFTSGNSRFVVLSKGHLHLGAISRLGENEVQLRLQLDALYMQILSTLTLPKMKQLFIERPSTDLRRPLQGTETLLSALADGFTRGSPSNLFAALECLKMRKSHRQIINSSFLKVKSPNVLYGLVLAGRRLVSVLRPKKHSLHPGDLQLIFNMLFEAKGMRSGGGENWIPLCLPGFNNTGYLYMYVSFLEATTDEEGADQERSSSIEDEIAIVLISPGKEDFFELRTMRDELVEQFEANGSMATLRSAVRVGRSSCTDIVPGTALRHFVYKSRPHVQFSMPSAGSAFQSPIAWRRLMTIYHSLNAAVHSRAAHQKVHHCVSWGFISLAWVTPVFELYCVASPTASRNAVAQGANKVVQWARREEERLFIDGGAVF